MVAEARLEFLVDQEYKAERELVVTKDLKDQKEIKEL